MKKISNANLQDKFDSAKYASYFTKEGIKHAKIGLEIYRKAKGGWEMISDNGIQNENCNVIRTNKWGGAY